MRKDFILILVVLLLAVLSADLLYLYYDRIWIEPIDLIRNAELLVLCFLIIAGIGIAVWRFIVLFGGRNE